jgi:hypothetical protein
VAVVHDASSDADADVVASQFDLASVDPCPGVDREGAQRVAR